MKGKPPKCEPVNPNEVFSLWEPKYINDEGNVHIRTWCNENTLTDEYFRILSLPGREFNISTTGTPYEQHLETTERIVDFLEDIGELKPCRWLVYGSEKVVWGAVCLPVELPTNNNPIIEIPGRDDVHLVVCPTTEPDINE